MQLRPGVEPMYHQNGRSNLHWGAEPLETRLAGKKADVTPKCTLGQDDGQDDEPSPAQAV